MTKPISAKRFTRAATAASNEAERYLPGLVRAYTQSLRKAGREASAHFASLATPLDAITADAAPPEGVPPKFVAPDVDEVVSGKSMADDVAARTRTTRKKAAEATAEGILAKLGISFEVGGVFSDTLMLGAGARAADMDASIRDTVVKAITQGLNEGLSVPHTADLIRGSVNDIAGFTAEMLARTDLVGLSNAASAAAARQVYPEGNVMKVWLATDDERTRPDHDDADGQTVPIDQPFDVGGDMLDYPGDPSGSDEQVCNCFPAETAVQFPGLRAVARRWYEGDLVRVRLASGDVLAGTPNHPVLGSDGWVALGSIHEGDDLVCGVVSRDELGAPDPDYPPSEIGEVYRLARVGGQSHRVGLTPPDFHGDGMKGQVEVVAVDGSLLIDSEAATDEQVEELGFALSDLASRTRSGLANSPALNSLPTSGFVSGRRKSAALAIGERRHADEICFGSVAERQVKFSETACDDRSADAEVVSYRENALAARVSLAQVIEVERYPFHGYVFNLDTGEGIYTANGIISANCRCTLIYEEVAAVADVPAPEPEIVTAAVEPRMGDLARIGAEMEAAVREGHHASTAWLLERERTSMLSAIEALAARPVRVELGEFAPQPAEAPNITIVVPDQAPPNVTVMVPEQPPPNVQVDVAAPNVNVEAPSVTVEAAAPVVVPAPQVTIEQPVPQRSVSFQRDGRGRIVSAEIEED